MFAVACAAAVAFADPRPVRLTADLSSPRFVVRAAAAEALDRLGPAALPALVAAARSPDPEAAARAGDLVARIGRRLAADRLLAPSLVRLPAGPVTVAAALAAVTAQTGYPVELTDPLAGAKPFAPPAGAVPAWAVLAGACAAGGLELASVAPRGPPRPAEAADPGRDLRRVQANLDGQFEDALHMAANALDALRANVRLADDPAEQARLTADLVRREEAVQQVARQVADRAVRREQARLAGLQPGPQPDGRVVLRAATGPAVTAVAGGALVEARAAPPHLAAGVPPGQVAVLLRVWPEPGRAVERVDGVWVKRAAAGGRELPRGPDAGADGPVRAVPLVGQRGGHIRLAADGRATLSDSTLDQAVGVCGPLEAVVRLVARPPAPDRLAELFGVVRAVVRERPAGLLAAGIPGTAVGPGLRLAVGPAAADAAGRTTLEVTVAYDPAGVRPAGGAGVRFEPDGPWGAIARGGGFLRWNANQAAAAAARCAPTAEGLTVLDAAGWVLPAVAVRAARTDGTAGRVADTLTLRVAPRDAAGPPARVQLGGARAVAVDLPFALADVPAAPGTAGPESP